MELTPKQVVEELDKYIIGQSEAKKAVAVALRNRYRRNSLPKDVRDEITPKNIIMKGPTGVGKTEIARRLARLVKAPFVKVEATKYTEVGYVGRDVESMIRDLVTVSINMVKEEKTKEVEAKASIAVTNKICDILFKNQVPKEDELPKSKEAIKLDYLQGLYDKEIIEVAVSEQPKSVNVIEGMGEINFGGILGGMFPGRKINKKMTVLKAKETLIAEEAEKLIDMDAVNAEGVRRAEEEGIVFIDEMDKIIGKSSSNGPDVSREGVQRDILPIVEGCTVNTKFGNVKTDFILFICAGAFHVSKVEDMIPELQGRFPVMVQLNSLKKDDFKRILKEPKNAITFQYESLLSVDKVNLEFTDDALEEIARFAEEENETKENIGARRLHTIMERLLEEISFTANGEDEINLKVTANYVKEIFKDNIKSHDLKKYVL
ncbi:MAG: ATP-dependent protease ATPase subunit HslU [Clostridiales bacterium]|nr:ATP-dependent protease ATPase subunit HslU [Clostridiales bacterium]